MAGYDSGVILCRHREALMSAFKASASYIQWSEHRDSMNFRPSMSARARVIELSGRSQRPWAGKESDVWSNSFAKTREALPGFYPSKGFRSTTMLFLTRCSLHVMTTPSPERRYKTSSVPVNAGVAAQPGMEGR